MAVIKPLRVTEAHSINTAMVAADAAGDTIDGHANLALVRNAGAGACAVTVVRGGDASVVVSVPAGTTHVIRAAGAYRLTYDQVATVTVAFLSV